MSEAARPIVVAAVGGDRCTCGWPETECLARALSNGPPFLDQPCEPAITLAEHHRRRKEIGETGVLPRDDTLSRVYDAVSAQLEQAIDCCGCDAHEELLMVRSVLMDAVAKERHRERDQS